MQAAIFHGHERITIERVAMPDVLAGEVLVRVSRTALCGSDFKLWHKGAEFTAGHEIFGVVEQPGHRLHGRRCAVYIPLHCDHCAACKRGDTQMCLEVSSLIGWNRPGAMPNMCRCRRTACCRCPTTSRIVSRRSCST